jgi:hypothetical protein
MYLAKQSFVISIIFAKGEEERYVFGPFGQALAYKCKGPILVKARKGSSPFIGSLIHLSRDTQSTGEEEVFVERGLNG